MWTPPHFWALSLYTSGDYAKAGVPMMPVAKGAPSTRLQILVYSLILAPLGDGAGLHRPWRAGLRRSRRRGRRGLRGRPALRLFFSRAEDAPMAGPDGLYAAKPGAKAARDLFAFSLLYLTLLFATLLGEHALKGLSA